MHATELIVTTHVARNSKTETLIFILLFLNLQITGRLDFGGVYTIFAAVATRTKTANVEAVEDWKPDKIYHLALSN